MWTGLCWWSLPFGADCIYYAQSRDPDLPIELVMQSYNPCFSQTTGAGRTQCPSRLVDWLFGDSWKAWNGSRNFPSDESNLPHQSREQHCGLDLEKCGAYFSVVINLQTVRLTTNSLTSPVINILLTLHVTAPLICLLKCYCLPYKDRGFGPIHTAWPFGSVYIYPKLEKGYVKIRVTPQLVCVWMWVIYVLYMCVLCVCVYVCICVMPVYDCMYIRVL